MVEDFLRECREELISSKIDLEEKMDLLRIKIRENEKFLDLLQSDESQVFTDFSPREIATKNTEKIKNLKKTVTDDVTEQNRIKGELDVINGKLAKISSIFENEFNPLNEKKNVNSREEKIIDKDEMINLFDEGSMNKGSLNSPSEIGVGSETVPREKPDDSVTQNSVAEHTTNTAVEEELQKEAEAFYKEVMGLKKKCRQIDTYILSDPMRGKIELKSIEKGLDKILEQFK